jgi:Flp pilus assembly pilin Flp
MIAGTFGGKCPLWIGMAGAGRSSSSTLMITCFIKNDRGASAIEYGLIAAAIGFAVSAILPLLGNN